MEKSDQLDFIDRFLNGSLEKEELRKLVYHLVKDEGLIRNFRLHTSMKGAFV
ncbi:MAG: hypothetical protein KAR09_02670 [Bacteroidales bacterium]|nr:hypothetical protein [Bacteroidales bacterium]